MPEPGIEITVSDPWGNVTTVLSGSKPEYGPGGFEVLAAHAGSYTVGFLGERFEVEAREYTLLLSFFKAPPAVAKQPADPEEDPPATAPSQPVDPPAVQPGSPEEPPDFPDTLLSEAEMLNLVLKRLDRVIDLLNAGQ
jgi:hypothetical protein